MEGNTAQTQSVAQQPLQQVSQPTPITVTQPVQPQNYSTSQSEHHTGKSFIKILILLIVIVGITAGIVFVGYKFMGANTTTVSPNPQNANVYNEPTKTVVSPTPSVYQSNPTDTSDSAINQDSQISGNNISNLNSSINDIDQSLTDKQTNLQ
jgi:hypothetical protein